MKKILFLSLVLMLTTITACEDSKKGLTPGGEPTPSVVTDCNLPENQSKPECTQQCAENPDLAWCTPEVEPKFVCPTDGSFKAVDPFSGEDISFGSPVTMSALSGNLMMSAKAFKSGDFMTLLAGQGVRLFVDQLGGAPFVDLGSTVTSIDTFVFEGKNYALSGTADNLKIVPFSKEEGELSPTIETGAIKSFDKIGGIKQVKVATSIDLSGGVSSKNLPSGMYASVNVPLSGETAAGGSGSINFVYLLTAKGDIWRIKFEHLLNGGCVERIYAASENLDSKNHKMIARKMDAAGQYVAILTSTEDSSLPELATEAQASWNNFVENVNNMPALILDEFYWFVNHLAEPANSAERVSILNLMTSKSGEFKNLPYRLQTKYRYQTTDLLLEGNKIYITGYKYDIYDGFVLNSSNKEIVDGMIEIWDKARHGSELQDAALISFVQSGRSVLLVADASNPLKFDENVLLPKTANMMEKTPTSIFARIATAENILYLRGENKYFASLGKSDVSNISSKQIVDANTLTPWATIFDSNIEELVTLFIIDTPEKIDAADIN